MQREAREAREQKEARAAREPREAKEAKEAREAKEGKLTKEAKKAKEAGEAREARGTSFSHSNCEGCQFSVTIKWRRPTACRSLASLRPRLPAGRWRFPDGVAVSGRLGFSL